MACCVRNLCHNEHENRVCEGQYKRAIRRGSGWAGKGRWLWQGGAGNRQWGKDQPGGFSSTPRLSKARRLPCGHKARPTARSTIDLLMILKAVADRKASFQSLGEQWADTTTAAGRLMLTILGGLAEFERELIKARTVEGRDRAKARGVRMGRKHKLTPISRTRFGNVRLKASLSGNWGGRTMSLRTRSAGSGSSVWFSLLLSFSNTFLEKQHCRRPLSETRKGRRRLRTRRGLRSR